MTLSGLCLFLLLQVFSVFVSFTILINIFLSKENTSVKIHEFSFLHFYIRKKWFIALVFFERYLINAYKREKDILNIGLVFFTQFISKIMDLITFSGNDS